MFPVWQGVSPIGKIVRYAHEFGEGVRLTVLIKPVRTPDLELPLPMAGSEPSFNVAHLIGAVPTRDDAQPAR